MMHIGVKRSAGQAFTIDSIMKREEQSSPLSSARVPNSRLSALNNHLLSVMAAQDRYYWEHLSQLGMNHPALAGALPSTLPGHMLTLPSLHSLLLSGGYKEGMLPISGRDQFITPPWMSLTRSGHLLGHRMDHATNSEFIMQPFRKPKRIRTAFSPAQLLQLEQAFEKNHYVVGQERKELARSLGLTETQVKVWFQNRRTKQKRTKCEDSADAGCNNSHVSSDIESDTETSDDEQDTAQLQRISPSH